MLRRTFLFVVMSFSLFVIMTVTLDSIFAQNVNELEEEVGSEERSFKLRREYLRPYNAEQYLHNNARWRESFHNVFENEQATKLTMEEIIKRRNDQIRENNKYRIEEYRIGIEGVRVRGTRVFINDKPLNDYIMRNMNLDFLDLRQLIRVGDIDSLSYVLIENCSFYAANLEESIFDRVHFVNCCFREANLRNINTLDLWITGSETMFRNCDFTGAEINGAKLSSISREQLLSTSNFRQYKDRKRVNLENCTLLGLNTYIDGTLAPDKDFDLSGIDFNKFNNGKPTPAPLNAVGITLGYFKMRNCSFVGGNFKDARIGECDLEGSNFTKTNLTGAQFSKCVLSKCNFSDAEIKNTIFLEKSFFGNYDQNFLARYNSYSIGINIKPDCFNEPFCICKNHVAATHRCDMTTPLPTAKRSITADQLKSTANYKRKELLSIGLGFSDLSGVDFSQFNLTGCSFMGNLQNANFTDAVISACSFGGCYAPNCDFNTLKTNFTIEQIKSTWNYKTGNMTGIKLPAEIQKTLDAEKQSKK